jgi:hypothetical protein
LGGEGILGLGQRADVDAAYGAGFPENLLRDGERRDDLVVFGGAGGEDAEDGELAAGNIECVAGLLG